MPRKLFLTIAILMLVTYGCSSTYPCGEPSTGKCLSVTDNYKRSYTNYTNPDDLDDPGFWSSSDSSNNNSKAKPVKFNFAKYPQIPSDGAPLLSQPKMIRVWITPYTDADNIYHDQSYEYVIVDRGKWNYSNNKLMLENNIKDVTPAQVSNSKSGGYGSFGMASQPLKPSTPTTPIISTTPITPGLSGFPAINALQNQQSPTITSTTIGSGIDRTTTITP